MPKRSVYVDPATNVLDRLSKEALIDLVIDIMRSANGDEPITAGEMIETAEPIMIRRGDDVPREWRWNRPANKSA